MQYSTSDKYIKKDVKMSSHKGSLRLEKTEIIMATSRFTFKTSNDLGEQVFLLLLFPLIQILIPHYSVYR